MVAVVGVVVLLAVAHKLIDLVHVIIRVANILRIITWDFNYEFKLQKNIVVA